jgi:hypothetical protein
MLIGVFYLLLQNYMNVRDLPIQGRAISLDALLRFTREHRSVSVDNQSRSIMQLTTAEVVEHVIMPECRKHRKLRYHEVVAEKYGRHHVSAHSLLENSFATFHFTHFFIIKINKIILRQFELNQHFNSLFLHRLDWSQCLCLMLGQTNGVSSSKCSLMCFRPRIMLASVFSFGLMSLQFAKLGIERSTDH